jgi:hypothetical protein
MSGMGDRGCDQQLIKRSLPGLSLSPLTAPARIPVARAGFSHARPAANELKLSVPITPYLSVLVASEKCANKENIEETMISNSNKEVFHNGLFKLIKIKKNLPIFLT